MSGHGRGYSNQRKNRRCRKGHSSKEKNKSEKKKTLSNYTYQISSGSSTSEFMEITK